MGVNPRANAEHLNRGEHEPGKQQAALSKQNPAQTGTKTGHWNPKRDHRWVTRVPEVCMRERVLALYAHMRPKAMTFIVMHQGVTGSTIQPNDIPSNRAIYMQVPKKQLTIISMMRDRPNLCAIRQQRDDAVHESARLGRGGGVSSVSQIDTSSSKSCAMFSPCVHTVTNDKPESVQDGGYGGGICKVQEHRWRYGRPPELCKTAAHLDS